MENKIVTYVISFILCIILFVSETMLLIQYNLNKGVEKQDIIKIIDNINIEDEIKKIDSYHKLETKIGRDNANEIINSDTLNTYVKENAKNIYMKIVYGEKTNYIDSNEFNEYINNKLQELQETNQITEEEKIEVLNITEEMMKEIDTNLVEAYNINDMNLIQKFMLKKTTKYLLLITILLSFGIILINKSKTGLLFTGLPTIITGVLFLILELSITQKINATGIDERVINTINTYLPNLIKTLKKSSIIMTIIGFIECTLYTILNYQEVGNNNGKN